MSIGGMIVDIDMVAMGQDKSSGTLNLEKKQIDRVFNPGKDFGASRQGLGLSDLLSIIIGHNGFTCESAHYSLTVIAI